MRHISSEDARDIVIEFLGRSCNLLDVLNLQENRLGRFLGLEFRQRDGGLTSVANLSPVPAGPGFTVLLPVCVSPLQDGAGVDG